jgi:CRISPR-associated protein Cas5 subtype I-B
MQAIQLSVSGSWGHFRRPETNRTPLTHDFMTKTALIGMMGAVLGIGRDEMRPLFPQLSEDLLYGVGLRAPIRKETHGFIVRSAKYPGRAKVSGKRKVTRRRYEFLRDPHFQIAVALADDRSVSYFDRFRADVETQKATFPPVLGWHNCPASLRLLSSGTFSDVQHGDFEARCFVSNDHEVNTRDADFHVGIDRVPTYQEDFWNLPDQYQTIVYPFGDHALEATGEFYEYDNGERWWLI